LVKPINPNLVAKVLVNRTETPPQMKEAQTAYEGTFGMICKPRVRDLVLGAMALSTAELYTTRTNDVI
jgi:hypothetical protein